MSNSDSILSPELVERVLAKLGLARRPDATLAGLASLYGTWCQLVPFDNVRKLIHMRAGSAAPLPGTTPDDFLANWLKHGTGGTCWSGNGAFYALLRALGFPAQRGIATMLAAPNLPPNHGTVAVEFDAVRYLVDCSMLHVEPLPLSEEETIVAHPAWGLQCSRREDRWHIAWRPLHKLDGFECRIERIGAEQAEFAERYEVTRGWSPFNYELSARINRGDTVVGAAFGHGLTLCADGSVERAPISHEQRVRLLIEQIGMSEEIVSQLPPDVPTPPPPGSNTARQMAQPA